MSTMVQQGPPRRSLATRLPAAMALPDLVNGTHTAVTKAARRAKRSGVASDFHRLRIRCKRLRYALEFSAEIYGGRTKGFTKQLTALQDQLGRLQDNEVAAARLSELATGEAHLPASTIFVMGGVAEQHRRETARLLDQLPAEVSRVRGQRWQELAVTMEQDREALLALVPPTRRALRVLPIPLASPHLADGDIDEARAVTSFVRQEAPRLAGGGDSPPFARPTASLIRPAGTARDHPSPDEGPR
jgi:hypothetical protein